jgi:hypothetical protein
MRKLWIAVALALSALVAGVSTTFAWGVQQVSGVDPYANCTAGAGQGDTSFPSAEVEPFIAASPLVPGNVIGAWQQDRWNDGGSRGLVSAYSFDGGRHFQQSTLPFTTCAPGGLNYGRASDPGIAFDRTGIAYSVAVVFDGPFGTCIRNGIAAARSFDGGKTWRDTRVISANVGAGVNCNIGEGAGPRHPGEKRTTRTGFPSAGPHGGAPPGHRYDGPSRHAAHAARDRQAHDPRRR